MSTSADARRQARATDPHEVENPSLQTQLEDVTPMLTFGRPENESLPINARPEELAAAIRAAYESARQGQLERAETLCVQVLRECASDPEATLLRAIIEMKTARPQQAAVSARIAIQADPSRPGTHALLGDALLALHRPEEALSCFEAALRIDASLASALFGRGHSFMDLDRPFDALGSYEQLLKRFPDDPEALFSRGNALLRLKRPDAALLSYDQAVKLKADYTAALSNRGSALMQLQRPDSALLSFDEAIAVDPSNAEAMHNRGGALRALGRLEDALHAVDRALQLRPDFAQAWISRGQLLRELRRPAEAMGSFERALALHRHSADALRGRGDSLVDLARPDEALAAYEAALGLGSGLAETHTSRGDALRLLRRFGEAAEAYDAALRIDPDHADAHFGRGTAFLQWDREPQEALSSYERALRLKPELDYAAGALYYGMQSRADWTGTAAAATAPHILRSVLCGRRTIAPFPFLSVTDSPAAQLRCAQIYSRFRCTPAAVYPTRRRDSRRPLRVAYVSADFREHPVSYLMAGTFEKHDRQRIEPIAISLRAEKDTPMGQRVRRALCNFHEVGDRSDLEIIDSMRELEIDIAVDLTGFTNGFRPQIFAQRCAPIQVNYLGFPGTMGAPFMDYILADDFVIPPEQRQHYSESVVYLPDCFQANDSGRTLSESFISRGEVGLAPDAFVFCCFNNTHKINPGMFDLWMRLLSRVPGSVLWLLGPQEAVRDNLRRAAAARGVDPARLVFSARRAYADYLAALRLADLYLDTVPFNAGATASDALWAGLPLLTCAGAAYASRMAGSLLRSLELPELITSSLEEYEARALDLALRREELGHLRQRLCENRLISALFDTDRFRRSLEWAFETMWMRRQGGEEPASFRVPPC